MSLKSLSRHAVITLLAFAAVWLLAQMALNFSLLSPVAQALKEFSMTDVYYQVMQDAGQNDTSRVVTIVDMTELTDRDELASLMERIEAQQPKVVGVDITFEVRKPDTLADAHLAAVAARYPNLKFSEKLLDYVDEATGYVGVSRSFFADSARIDGGFTNFERNLYGGMKRSLTLTTRVGGRSCRSLVAVLADSYAEADITTGKDDELDINFMPTTFRVVAPDEVESCGEWMTDQMVLLGAMNDDYDQHYTPLGRMAGVELLAYAVQTLIQQREISEIPPLLRALLSFLLVMLTHIMLTQFQQFARQRRQPLLSFLLGTTFVQGLLLFLWMALLVWLGFLLFYYCRVSINLGWALAAIPLLDGSQEFSGLIFKQFLKR